MVAWEKVQAPKDLGGPCLGLIKLKNLGLLLNGGENIR